MAFLWLNKPPRLKLEQLQKSKDAGPWIYYLTAQLQHIAQIMSEAQAGGWGMVDTDPIKALICHTTGVADVAMGLEALVYAKSNKWFPTYALIQKV